MDGNTHQTNNGPGCFVSCHAGSYSTTVREEENVAAVAYCCMLYQPCAAAADMHTCVKAPLNPQLACVRSASAADVCFAPMLYAVNHFRRGSAFIMQLRVIEGVCFTGEMKCCCVCCSCVKQRGVDTCVIQHQSCATPKWLVVGKQVRPMCAARPRPMLSISCDMFRPLSLRLHVTHRPCFAGKKN